MYIHKQKQTQSNPSKNFHVNIHNYEQQFVVHSFLSPLHSISATQQFNFSPELPPLILPTSIPLLKQINVGIIATFNFPVNMSQSSPSISNVINVQFLCADAAETYAGCITLHGVHQSAVNLTNSTDVQFDDLCVVSISSHLCNVSTCSTLTSLSSSSDVVFDVAVVITLSLRFELLPQHPFVSQLSSNGFFLFCIRNNLATKSGNKPTFANCDAIHCNPIKRHGNNAE